MDSISRQTTINCLQDNLGLLMDAFGNVAPENKVLWNISNALLGIGDEMNGEFQHIQTRLTNIEQQLQNLSR